MKKITALITLVIMILSMMPGLTLADEPVCNHNFVDEGNNHRCVLCSNTESHTEDEYGICSECGYCNPDHIGTWTELPNQIDYYFTSSGYYYLATDTIFTNDCVTESGSKIIIDLAGYNLFLNGCNVAYLGGSLSYYDSGDNGTIHFGTAAYSNLLAAGNGTISVYNVDFASKTSENAALITTYDCFYDSFSTNNHIVLKNVTANDNVVTTNTPGGLIYVSNGNTIEMTGCSFSNNENYYYEDYCWFGGAVLFNEGIATITDCEFTGNKTNGNGGAICSWPNDNQSMKQIASMNTEKTKDIGVKFLGSSSPHLYIEKCDFNNNESCYGGAIFAAENFLTIKDSKINNNLASATVIDGNCGGAIAAVSCNVQITGSQISDNSLMTNFNEEYFAEIEEELLNDYGVPEDQEEDFFEWWINYNNISYGGAIYLYSCEYVGLDKCYINRNDINNLSYSNGGRISGGAIYIENTNGVEINNCEINDNKIETDTKITEGAAINIYQSGNINIDKCEINKNEGKSQSSYIDGTLKIEECQDINLTNSDFNENVAQSEYGNIYGAAISIYDDVYDVEINNCNVLNNKSKTEQGDCKGIMYLYEIDPIKIADCKINYNEAEAKDGSCYGGVIQFSQNIMEVDGLEVKNNITKSDNSNENYGCSIYLDWSTATLSNIEITDNFGGGIYSWCDIALGGKNIIEGNVNNDEKYKDEPDNFWTRETIYLMDNFDTDSKVGVSHSTLPTLGKPDYFIVSNTKDCSESFTLDYPKFLLTKKYDDGKYYIGRKTRVISEPDESDKPAYTYELDLTDYTGAGKSVEYTWTETTRELIASNTIVPAYSFNELHVATLTDMKKGDYIYIEDIDYSGYQGGVKIYIEGEDEPIDEWNYTNDMVMYEVEEDGTYYIGGVCLDESQQWPWPQYDLNIGKIYAIRLIGDVSGQTSKYPVNGGNGTDFEKDKHYLCKAVFNTNGEEDFSYISNPITVTSTENIKVYVPEESSPVVAPIEIAIPKVFIGETKPEINIKVELNTYNNGENQFSAEAPIFIENGRTYLGVRDMANALNIDPMAIKWDDKTKTATIRKNGATLEITEGSNIIKMTYRGYIYSIKSDVSAVIKNDRLYLPFRIIFEQFGYEVNWDNETRTISCK